MTDPTDADDEKPWGAPKTVAETAQNDAVHTELFPAGATYSGTTAPRIVVSTSPPQQSSMPVTPQQTSMPIMPPGSEAPPQSRWAMPRANRSSISVNTTSVSTPSITPVISNSTKPCNADQNSSDA